jgi:hypothetical protein
MMHEQKEEGKEHEMMMLWEKLGDSEKKTIMLRKLDAKIMKKEQWIKALQYKVETLKMIKTWVEKM